MGYSRRFLLGILLTSALSARESYDEYLFEGEAPSTPKPWFTGPILTPSGHVIPEGHQNYEPYVYWTQAKAKYDEHWKAQSHPTFDDILFQTTMQFGVLPHAEFDMAPQFVYNKIKDQHMWRVSDLPIAFAVQIIYDEKDNWYPGTKLRFGANVPLGKHDRLNPARIDTDVGGIGSWAPSVGIVLTRLHHITGAQFLSWRLFFSYNFGTPVNVKGLSVYGGAPSIGPIKGTRGTVYLGNIFLFLGGFEYSLSQRWALALDIQYQHNNKNRFSGYTPLNLKPGGPSKELFSLAPAIEYNWSSKLGIIAGPWFTVAGRNTQKFISYVVAVNIYN